jgi:hypothetical protein
MSFRSPAVARFLEPLPEVLVRHGRVNRRAMKREMITLDELEGQAARAGRGTACRCAHRAAGKRWQPERVQDQGAGPKIHPGRPASKTRPAPRAAEARAARRRLT